MPLLSYLLYTPKINQIAVLYTLDTLAVTISLQNHKEFN